MHNLPDQPQTKVTGLVVQEVDLDRLARGRLFEHLIGNLSTQTVAPQTWLKVATNLETMSE
jgi:hypothetical protein